MKKILFTLVCIVAYYCSFAQTNAFPATGNVGIGTTSPLTRLHIVGSGSSVDGTAQINGDAVAIQANTGGRSITTGAQLEFVIPANTDGTNLYGQGRIVTVAGNSNTFDATGKMILGTRRVFDKLGTGPSWYYGNDIVIDGNGSVGVGTTTPDEKLVVNGNIKVILDPAFSNKNVARIISLGVSGPTGARNWALRGVYQYPYGVNLNAVGGDIDLIKSQDGNTILGTKTDGTALGNVGIGTVNPQNKLDVNGTIHSKQVNVDLNGWPDYVFKKDYQLPSLQEVKTYIDQNHHLPEMPSEQQVAKDGLNLGEMNKLLTKKVEELTLYLIEKDNKDKEQTAQINQLKAQVELLIKNSTKQ